MKTKFFFNAVMAALVAAIFSMLMGCAGTGATVGGDPGTAAAELAEQLAVDINAIEAEKATVSGDTVTLTGGVRLENTALTVPEGVTLDLTADGAELELQDGAVLIVNGTVNARGHGDHGDGWVEGSLRIGEGAAAINGSGTINLKSKGRLLNIGSDKELKQLTLDGVTLVGLPDNDQPLVGIYENSEFIMKSGKITGNTRNDKDWASGGGLEVNRGTFTMEGGEISGNAAKGERGGSGGGVHIGGGTFTMEGGAITGNTAKGGKGAEGGGVRTGESTFTEGGTISGNSVTSDESAAGGVFVHDSFLLKGGRIQGSEASDGFAANTVTGGKNAALGVWGTAKWGTGGAYTKGGAAQTGGSNIGSTDDTLIAEPAK